MKATKSFDLTIVSQQRDALVKQTLAIAADILTMEAADPSVFRKTEKARARLEQAAAKVRSLAKFADIR